MTNPKIGEAGKKTQFKKGHPALPGAGRPPGSISITDALRRLMECTSPKLHPITGEKIKMRDEIGMAAMKKALTGDTAAINLILDRLEGKVPQKNEQTGKDGEPIKIEVEHAICLSAIDERLAELITEGTNTDNPALPEK
jgi:hypothetical protein